jgi:hypothetical protein
MKNFYLLSLLTLISMSFANSQSAIGHCGTSIEDQYQIRDRMFQNREKMEHLVLPRSGVIRYIPVNVHLVAKADGTGRSKVTSVFESLCAVNEIYLDQEIQFYVKTINFVNNTNLYDNPSSDLGASWARSISNSYRNGLNFFVAKVARADELGVLAFYSPNGDYVVTGVHQSQLLAREAHKIAHEFGHFFSLAHTFFGWEATTYTCSTPTPKTVSYAGSTFEVEYVDRNKRVNGTLNCKIAADGFCDTPADYNLGYGWSGGCNYVGCAKDPDEVLLDPMESNIMGYFLNCLDSFTTEQKAAINRDYLSSSRLYLRPAFTPLGPISGNPVIVEPLANSTTSGYNSVKLDWEPLANATHYFIEIGETVLTNKNRNFLTRRTDTTLVDLLPGKKYAWRVIGYNANNFCITPSNALFFTTGQFPVASNDPQASLIAINAYSSQPNQLVLEINIDRQSDALLEIFNLEGKRISSSNIQLQNGSNQTTLYLDQKGVYLYRLSTSDRVLSGKTLVQ